MKFVRQFDRYVNILYLLTIISVVFTSYFTFKEVIDNYHKQQREALVPLFSIVNSELIRPLNIAHFMANDKFLIDYIHQGSVKKPELLSYLQRISKDFDMLSFVASEKHGYIIESTGKTSNLKIENAEWFHRLKALPNDYFVDIGKFENPHLYFDIKLKNEHGKFLGFAGVGIDLNHFAQRLAYYQEQFGFELIFTDSNDNIALTSNHLMRTDSHHRDDALIPISSLPWYQYFSQKHANGSMAQIVSSIPYEGSVISRMPINDIEWQLYIIAPSASEQLQYWQLLAGRLGFLFTTVIALYISFLLLLHYFKRKLVQGSEIDYLTQLPNRGYVNWRFDELKQKHDEIIVVLADIDKFKQLNDSYGHPVGDIVLKDIAKQLGANLRKDDLVGRWGGEEFIILLPNASLDSAFETVDRLRERIAKMPFYFANNSQCLHTSISFGISNLIGQDSSLEALVSSADRALYLAKANGRNRVEIDAVP